MGVAVAAAGLEGGSWAKVADVRCQSEGGGCRRRWRAVWYRYSEAGLALGKQNEVVVVVVVVGSGGARWYCMRWDGLRAGTVQLER